MSSITHINELCHPEQYTETSYISTKSHPYKERLQAPDVNQSTYVSHNLWYILPIALQQKLFMSLTRKEGNNHEEVRGESPDSP